MSKTCATDIFEINIRQSRGKSYRLAGATAARRAFRWPALQVPRRKAACLPGAPRMETEDVKTTSSDIKYTSI